MPLLDFFSRTSDDARARSLAELSPVVVMGRGHSGTRVLSWICFHLGIQSGNDEDSHPGDVSDRGLQEEIKAIALRSLDVTRASEAEPALARRFQRAASNYFTSLGEPAGPWGWKFPETYLIGPCVAVTFPKARYIHLVRDGRDVAFKLHTTDDPKRKLGRAILERTGTLDAPHHLQAAASWEFQVKHFEAFQAALPAGQVCDVTFSELCSKPNETVNRLLNFLSLPMTEACQRYLTEEVNAAKVAQYRESDPQLVREVEDRIRGTLAKYGFLK